MAFNAYLVFATGTEIKGESTSDIAKDTGAIEIADFGFGVSMPVTASRSDGGGATVGRAVAATFIKFWALSICSASKKPWSWRMRVGWRILRSALASI